MATSAVPSKQSQIVALATRILENVQLFSDHLDSNSLPQPTFEADGPNDLSTNNESVDKARFSAIEDVIELQDLLLGPKVLLRPQWNAVSLQAIYRYDLARLVPLDGDTSFSDLAKDSGLYEPDLKRILRYAMIYHRTFQEPRKGFVAHTAASKAIATDENVKSALGLMFDESYQSYAKTVDAMQKFKDRTVTHTGFSLAHDTGLPYFQYLQANPEKYKRFAGAMAAFGQSEDVSPAFLATAFAWDRLGKATLVDVGGATGAVDLVIASKHANLSFVVQDKQAVIADAEKQDLSPELRRRFTFQSHDFFNPQPVVAEAYLFRYVLHNWPDAYAVDILRQIIPALKEGSRVVIHDSLLPEPRTASSTTEREVRSMDMLMLTLSNARERELDDWRKLLQDADPRFYLLGHVVPASSSLAVMEVVWTTDASAHKSLLNVQH